MINNQKVTLRAVAPEDLDFFYKYENSPMLWVYGSRKEPFSKFDLKEYICSCDKSIYECGQLRLMIVENETNQTIGTVDLFNFDYHNQRAETGIFITQEFQNQGFGYNAMQLITQYAFEFLVIRQIYSIVTNNNVAAIKLFAKVGFLPSTVIKNWFFHNQKFWDVTLFQLIK
jgi:diamine N-acetyltransferase